MNHSRAATVLLCANHSVTNSSVGHTEVKGNFVVINGSSEVGLSTGYYGYIATRGTVTKRHGPSTWRPE